MEKLEVVEHQRGKAPQTLAVFFGKETLHEFHRWVRAHPGRWFAMHRYDEAGKLIYEDRYAERYDHRMVELGKID